MTAKRREKSIDESDNEWHKDENVSMPVSKIWGFLEAIFLSGVVAVGEKKQAGLAISDNYLFEKCTYVICCEN